nr:hypothetical protein [uncultured Flavobacterium sp.]
MKRISFYLTFFTLLTFSLFSCTENEDLDLNVSSKDNVYNSPSTLRKVADPDKPQPGVPVKHHFILIDFDGFGRTSKDCKGFGLCNFESCTNCCTDAYGTIVSCKTGEKQNDASFVFLDAFDKGYLLLELNLENKKHLEILKHKETLFVDEDLIRDGIVLKKGEYTFDKSIGDNGGYTILAEGL